MIQLLLQAISLLPNITIIIIIAYFYFEKKIPGLVVMLIAYIVLTLVTASSIYGVRYFQEKGMAVIEMQRMYTIIGIVSLVAHLALAIGLGVMLSSYPDKKDDLYFGSL